MKESSALDVFQHPQFEHFLSVSKSWRKSGDLKQIFAIVLLELTHVVHNLKRGCDVTRVIDMIVKRAKKKQYSKSSLVIFKKGESSWLESFFLKGVCDGCEREVVEEEVEEGEVGEGGDVGDGQNDQMVDVNNQLEDEEEEVTCREKCCRKGGQVEEEDVFPDVLHGGQDAFPRGEEDEPPAKRVRKELPYSLAKRSFRFQKLSEEVKRISRDPQLEEVVLERLQKRSIKRSREEEDASPTEDFFDENLSCFNCIDGANMSMNNWDFVR